MVISREVEKAEFVAPDYAKVGRSDARNTYTIRYTSLDSTKGEIVDVVYDAEDNIPEEVIYYNAFSFGMSAMPTEMDVTFAKTGEIKRYYVVFEGVENIMSINHKNLKDLYPQNFKNNLQESNM